MIRTGFVKEKKGERLRVCFERPDSCEGCKGCGKGFLPKKELLTVFGQAEVGDMVEVQLPEGKLFKATLLAYVLPLLFLIAGLALGTLLKMSDAVTVLLAFAGLAVGYALARAVDMKLRARPQWRPTVIKAYPAAQNDGERK